MDRSLLNDTEIDFKKKYATETSRRKVKIALSALFLSGSSYYMWNKTGSNTQNVTNMDEITNESQGVMDDVEVDEYH